MEERQLRHNLQILEEESSRLLKKDRMLQQQLQRSEETNIRIQSEHKQALGRLEVNLMGFYFLCTLLNDV